MNSDLEIIVWDVQHGNAIYMKTPNGRNVMFDIGTGSHAKGKEFSPLKFLKNYWEVDCLHYLVISHPHADHISDISNMFDLGIEPLTLTRPKCINPALIKKSNQPRYAQVVEDYLELDKKYICPVNGGWLDASNRANYGDVQINCFSQQEEGINNLNNYSIVAVVEYAGEKIVIPGDIEAAGWKALLEKANFRQTIIGTTIFVAAHHGREAGYHGDIFKYFKPDIVIVSDGPSTDTSVTNRYTNHAKGTWIKKRSAGFKKRSVLTTRNDGWIHILVHDTGRQITIN